MKNYTKKVLIGIAGVSMAVVGLGLYTNAGIASTVVKNDKSITASPDKKKEKSFYSADLIATKNDAKFISYPSNFNDLVKSGDLTIQGTVTKLENHVTSPFGSNYASVPFTLATIKIDKLLAGTAATEGELVKVLFVGGNISKKEFFVDMVKKDYVSDAEKEKMKSDTMITVKNSESPLPLLNESMALVLTLAPDGTNEMDEEYYMASYLGKGVFLYDETTGLYEREPEPQSIGGGENGGQLRSARSTSTTVAEDDEMMNKGMNDLITSKN